jgi:APA family basic amino acid/polyamine antiporter
MSGEAAREEATLVRGLGTWDATSITVGSVIGTGVFLTTADIARVLPHPGLILLVWVAGGLVTLAGALTYGELGAMFPRAGGAYVYLREAYGPLWGFLYGWVSFLVIMCGGIAALSVGFAEYLGAFLPFFSTRNVLFSVSLGGWPWSVSGGQAAAVAAIAFLTAVNYVGLREGAGLQNAVTVIKIGSILALGLVGVAAPAPVAPALLAPLPATGLLASLGVAMIAVFWTFDGWYGAATMTGEMRTPERSLPRGLVAGTLIVTALYVLLNLVYLRALPVAEMGSSERIAETAASALFGPVASRAVSLAVLVSTFGCLSATILYAPRIYLAMAEDGLFFRGLARIHPRYRTPGACILAQGIWSGLLALSGTYEQLYTYSVFAVVLFYAATGAAVLVLRRTRPEASRPYRAWGYPVVPAGFVLVSLAFVANTLVERPIQALAGLGLMALGLPAYAWWRARPRP